MNVLRRVGTALTAPVIAILVSVVITSLVITMSGSSAGDFWGVIFSAPPNGARSFVNIVNQSSLIYISALAAAIGFRMNLFNIGVEGQYTVASYVAAAVAGAAIFPGLLNVLIPLVLAVLVGAGWAGIAGLLKVTRGVSEVISTIMLNAIAITLYGYFLNKYGTHEGNIVRTSTLPQSSQLSGWVPFEPADGAIWTLSVLAVLLGVGFWFLLNKTRFGFDLRATGISQSAAVASGVNVNRMVVTSMLLSGGVAGLIWMPAFFGQAHSIGPTFQAGLGFTGIAVALLGRNQPLGILFGAALFAFLNEQSNRLQLETDISTEIVQITQGVIVLSVVVAYEVVRRSRVRLEQRNVAQRLAAEASSSESRQVTA
ncbi:MAG: ABC transporter permease [Nocardioidaceae bacterium]